jgi:hypothetical protein
MLEIIDQKPIDLEKKSNWWKLLKEKTIKNKAIIEVR